MLHILNHSFITRFPLERIVIVILPNRHQFCVIPCIFGHQLAPVIIVIVVVVTIARLGCFAFQCIVMTISL